mgnify:FL=1
MNYQEFINTYNGKGFDYDGVSGIQCVDLAKMYLDKVFNIKAGAWGNAKDYYENFNNLPLKNSFTRIANTPSFVPQKGDIVIWGRGLGNIYGHIAIATGEGNTHQFYSYDLNWGQKVVHKVLHNYKGFLGVLRPNDQNKIEGNKYTPGTYKTTASLLNVRTGAGTNYPNKSYNQLTANAQAQNGKLGNSKANGLLKGCTCTVSEVEGNWGKIPSGWICLDYCIRV